MATIAENLKTIVDCKSAIKQAIIDKGGQVGDLTTYADAIANLPSGGGDVNPTAEKNDVTFYDYDGSILYSYTAEEFLALTEMPPLPTQKGLICQEWNWSHEDAVEYVTEYGILDVGATYITDDGKTRLYIRIAAEGRMDIPLYFQQTVANGVTIDWGDGTPTETLDGTGNINITHRYASIGDYVISLDVAEGCTLTLGQGNNHNLFGQTSSISSYVNSARLISAELGRRTLFTSQVFMGCRALKTIAMPKGIQVIRTQVFTSTGISFLVVPNGTTEIKASAFATSRLVGISMPSSVTTLENYAFQRCYFLKSLVLPPSITTVGQYLCSENGGVSYVIIPNNVVSIGNYAFNGSNGFASFVLPPSLMSFSSSAFQYARSVAFYDFSRHTAIPTLANTSVFVGIPEDCKIIVPDALYDEWIAATNWSTYSNYIIKKTDWDNL